MAVKIRRRKERKERAQSSSFPILATQQNYVGCFTEISMLGYHPRGSDFF